MSFQFKLERSLPAAAKLAALRDAGNSIADDVYIGEDVEIIGNQITLGRQAIIENGTKLVFDRAAIGDGVRIEHNSDIRAGLLTLESGITLGYDMRILVAEYLRIGRNSYIGHSGEIVCKWADIGEGLYCEHDVCMGGGGGATGLYSELRIGRFVHVGEFSVLNTARPLTIGDEAGLGAHVMLYTHGMWPPALEGYPVSFGSVTVGAKAWITGRCIVLPGLTVGEGAVVAMGSVITKDLPPRCLAGGVPAKVLLDGLFDRKPSDQEKDTIIRDILARYVPELEFKGFTVQYRSADHGVLLQVGSTSIWYAASADHSTWPNDVRVSDGRRIILTWGNLGEEITQDGLATIFDLGSTVVLGGVDDLSEDLRDFLRRNCVRFYTKDKFHSVQSPLFARLAKE